MTIEDAINEAEEKIKSECDKVRAMGFQVEEHEDYSLLTKDGVVIRIDWEGIHVLKGKKNDHTIFQALSTMWQVNDSCTN